MSRGMSGGLSLKATGAAPVWRPLNRLGRGFAEPLCLPRARTGRGVVSDRQTPSQLRFRVWWSMTSYQRGRAGAGRAATEMIVGGVGELDAVKGKQ